MQTIKIPDYVSPTWSCVINGKTYSYPSGTTQNVPDEVAALIANIANGQPQKRPRPAAGVTEIGEDSTDYEVPTAKAVKDYVDEHGGGGGDVSREIIAADYSNETRYYNGDYVLFDGKLYKCIADGTVIEVLPTDTNYWENVVLTGEFADINDDISTLATRESQHYSDLSTSVGNLNNAKINYSDIVNSLEADSSMPPSATAVRTKIAELISLGFEFKIVASLPTAGEATMRDIYLVKRTSSNIYDQYITTRSGGVGSYSYSWEPIGDTEADLSGYITEDDIVTSLDADNDMPPSTTAVRAALSDNKSVLVIDCEMYDEHMTSIGFIGRTGLEAYQDALAAIDAGIPVYFRVLFDTSEGMMVIAIVPLVSNTGTILAEIDSNDTHVIISIEDDGSYLVRQFYIPYKDADFLSQEITNVSGDNEIPSSAAVYDYAQAKIDASHKLPYANISDTPSSLPANGGNADTIDSYHIVVENGTHTGTDAHTLYLVTGA